MFNILAVDSATAPFCGEGYYRLFSAAPL